MADFAEWLEQRGIKWPKNLIPAASIINAGFALQAKHLLRINAPCRALSCEPLDHQVEIPAELLSPSTWMIVGGESGDGASTRPFALEWARHYRNECERIGAPYFLKQLGGRCTEEGKEIKFADSHGGDWSEWPADLRVRQFPDAIRRIGLEG